MNVCVTQVNSTADLELTLNIIGYENVLNVLFTGTHPNTGRKTYTIIVKRNEGA